VDFGTLSESRRVEAGGTSLFVRSWGKPGARPVLCWHGVGLTSLASLRFAEAGPLLAAQGFHVLALDAPGFGGSPAMEPRRYHPHALAGLVPPLLDALEIERAAFMGHSWGGDVGCHVTARYPQRVAALVLLDAGYSDPPFDPFRPYEECLERYEALARETPGATVPPRVVAAVEHGIAQALPSTTRPALAVGGLPVLLVAAADAPEEDLAAFAADVPQAELLRPAGVGHDVLGDGGPPIVRAVGDWLGARSS
jgi:pimeloyl-ACP methyl ester carboxylesterase